MSPISQFDTRRGLPSWTRWLAFAVTAAVVGVIATSAMNRWVVDLTSPLAAPHATLACSAPWTADAGEAAEVLDVVSAPETIYQAIRAAGVSSGDSEVACAAWAGRLHVDVQNDRGVHLVRLSALPIDGLNRAQTSAVLDQLVLLYAEQMRREELAAAAQEYEKHHASAEVARAELARTWKDFNGVVTPLLATEMTFNATQDLPEPRIPSDRDDVQAQLVTLRAQRDLLLETRMPEHPEVIAVVGEIDRLEQRLRRSERVQGLTSSRNNASATVRAPSEAVETAMTRLHAATKNENDAQARLATAKSTHSQQLLSAASGPAAAEEAQYVAITFIVVLSLTCGALAASLVRVRPVMLVNAAEVERTFGAPVLGSI